MLSDENNSLNPGKFYEDYDKKFGQSQTYLYWKIVG